MAYPQALLDEFRREPGSVAFEHGARRVTRGETLELVGRFTAGLRAAGLGPGDGVGVATAVTAEGYAAQLAAQVLGCRVVGVRPGLPVAQLRHVVGDVEALVVDKATESPELLATVAGARILRIGPELLAAHEDPVPAGRPDDIATVVFTSGSTGAPKGAAFTYRALTENGVWQPPEPGSRLAELREGYGRFLLFGTLTSAVMLEHLTLCLLSGGTAVIPEDLPDFPWVLPRLRVTASLMTVPRLYQVLEVLRTERVDLSGLRSLLVAGSPVSPHKLAEAFERIGPAVHQAYGQTEAGMLTLLSSADVAASADALGSVGKPCGTVELEVRDSAGHAVGTGVVGEIWVRTSAALAGYWRDEAETAEVLREGWVRTRDLGMRDDEGFVHLTGRTRDVVIVNAIVHYTGPMERAIAAHPDVDQAYVVAAPDERTGEAAHAFVVPVPGRTPDPGSLRKAVAVELGEAAVPATFTFVDAVPVGPSGKPDKLALLQSIVDPVS